MAHQFQTPSGALDVQALLDYLRTSEVVDSVSANPTGMRNDGPTEFHATLRYSDGNPRPGQEVVGDVALSLPDHMSVTARRTSSSGLEIEVED